MIGPVVKTKRAQILPCTQQKIAPFFASPTVIAGKKMWVQTQVNKEKSLSANIKLLYLFTAFSNLSFDGCL